MVGVEGLSWLGCMEREQPAQNVSVRILKVTLSARIPSPPAAVARVEVWGMEFGVDVLSCGV